MKNAAREGGILLFTKPQMKSGRFVNRPYGVGCSREIKE